MPLLVVAVILGLVVASFVEAARQAALDPVHRADPRAVPAGHQRADADADRLARRPARPRLPRRRLLDRPASARSSSPSSPGSIDVAVLGRLSGAGRCPRPADARSLPVAMVCLGNICRSPMAEVVLTAAARRRRARRPRSRSPAAGTGGWHVGDPMDQRAAATLTARGVRRQPAPRPAARPRLAGTTTARPAAGDGRAATCATCWPAAPSRAGCGCSATSTRSTPGADVPDPYYGGAGRLRGGAGDGRAHAARCSPRRLATALDGDPAPDADDPSAAGRQARRGAARHRPWSPPPRSPAATSPPPPGCGSPTAPPR